MQLKKVVRGTFFAAIAMLAVSIRGTAFADPTVTLSKWVEDIKISGDMRLRQEYFDRKTDAAVGNNANQTDRSRQRYRLRLNIDFKLPQKFSVKTTFASGTGEQTSTNQSFDNLSVQKSIWIDKAYVTYQPWSFLRLQGGRMDNPIWRQYSSDAVWDTDFNPEGFSQSVETLVGPIRVFANALQMVADEDSGTTGGPSDQQNDQWMLGEQIGVEFRLPLESRLKAAAANYYWKNENFGSFGSGPAAGAAGDVAPGALVGNRRLAGGGLANNFNVMEYTGELSAWMFAIPISLQGTYIVNKGARDDLGSSFATTRTDKLDTGYQVGGIIGKAREKNTWELAYFNKWVQADATVSDVTDSDFGDGGTNKKGDIFWIAYAPQDWMVIQLKHIHVDVLTRRLAPSVGNALGEEIRRTQFDVSWKF